MAGNDPVMSDLQVLIPHHRFLPAEMQPLLSSFSKFGFSGSRKRFSTEDKQKILEIVDLLPPGSTVISGQCSSKVTTTIVDETTGMPIQVTLVNENTDRWSVARAIGRGLATIEHPPSYPNLQAIRGDVARGDMHSRSVYLYITQQNYARNEEIVGDSDVLIALPPAEIGGKNGKLVKKSGTWHTIRLAIDAGKPVYVNLEGDHGWILVLKSMLKIPTASW